MKLFNNQKYIKMSVGLFIVTLFAGCDWFKSKKSSKLDSSDTLLSIKGKPVLSVEAYEQKVEAAKQSNPQISQLLSMMPNAEKDLIFRGFMLEELMKVWGQEQGLDKNKEFQETRQKVHDSIDAQLYFQEFDKAHPVHVSDDEVKKFYHERKDTIPGLVVTPAKDGKAAQYRDVNDPEVKEGLRRMLSDERKQKQLESLIEELKHQFDVQENSTYFENKFGKQSDHSDEQDHQDMVHMAQKV